MPAIVFIDCMHVQAATRCAAAIQDYAPGVITVGIGYNPAAVLDLLRSGVRELLPLPLLDNCDAEQAILNVQRLLSQNDPAHSEGADILSFVPAKPGVGASVAAVNTAIALAAVRPDKRVLLCDCDTTAGMAAFLLKVPPEHSFASASEVASRLDEDLWRNLVTRRGRLDIIGPGTLSFPHHAEYEAVERIVAFASRLYDTIIVDFSGAIEPFCTAIMKRSQHVFLVVTQETAALHLGRVKAEALIGMQLQQRLSAVLNRYNSKHPLSNREIEKLLQIPVRYTFLNDDTSVNAAIMGDGAVYAGSRLGRQFRQFTASLAPCPVQDAPAQRKSFFRFFSELLSDNIIDRVNTASCRAAAGKGGDTVVAIGP